MKKIAGVWIDHRKAVISQISDKGTRTEVIESNVDEQPGRTAGVRATGPFEPYKVPADDHRERAFMGHLHGYYDEVIEILRDAESILIFGPGEAKIELKDRLEKGKLGGRIVAVETADKMTDRQIAAKVRRHFER